MIPGEAVAGEVFYVNFGYQLAQAQGVREVNGGAGALNWNPFTKAGPG